MVAVLHQSMSAPVRAGRCAGVRSGGENVTVLFRVKDSSLWQTIAEELRSDFPDVDFVISLEPDIDVLKETGLLITYGETADSLESFSRLEVVFVPMAGVNQLPLPYLAERGIQLSNAHSNGKYVAERALALTLGLLGKVVPFHNDLTQGKWHGFAVEEPVHHSWSTLFGSTVAILGVGSVGWWAARLLKPFEVESRGYHGGVSERDKSDFSLLTTDLEKVLRGSDIVIVTLPLTSDTVDLISERELHMMEKGILVNVGRGAVVNQFALYNALTDGTIAGAAIDTWYTYPGKSNKECAPSDAPLHKLDNVLLSPHVGGYTAMATRSSIDDTIRNLRTYLSTGSLEDMVNTERGY